MGLFNFSLFSLFYSYKIQYMHGEIYFDERQRKKRRRFLKLKIYGGIITLFILIAAAVYVIAYSPLFHIKNIIQTNNDLTQVNADQLIKNLKNFFANQSKIAGFLGPDNILIWNKEALTKFTKAPAVAGLTIKKDYFKREIQISVKERERFGVWCPLSSVDNASTTTAVAGGCWWFDRSGVIFAEASQLEGQLINKVDDFSGQSLEAGKLVLEEKFLNNLIKIFDVLDKSGLKIKSLRLENLQLQEIVANPSAAALPKIYFSLRFDPGFGVAAIESLKNLGLEKISYIDLRAENRVYYKLK